MNLQSYQHSQKIMQLNGKKVVLIQTSWALISSCNFSISDFNWLTTLLYKNKETKNCCDCFISLQTTILPQVNLMHQVKFKIR